MDKENFARLIKRYRYERGLSQREFAKLIGAAVVSVRDWESCKREVSEENYATVMRLLYPAKAKRPPTKKK